MVWLLKTKETFSYPFSYLLSYPFIFCAFPVSPKPPKKWGAGQTCGLPWLPIVQSFGCSMAHRTRTNRWEVVHINTNGGEGRREGSAAHAIWKGRPHRRPGRRSASHRSGLRPTKMSYWAILGFAHQYYTQYYTRQKLLSNTNAIPQSKLSWKDTFAQLVLSFAKISLRSFKGLIVPFTDNVLAPISWWTSHMFLVN